MRISETDRLKLNLAQRDTGSLPRIPQPTIVSKPHLLPMNYEDYVQKYIYQPHNKEERVKLPHQVPFPSSPQNTPKFHGQYEPISLLPYHVFIKKYQDIN